MSALEWAETTAMDFMPFKEEVNLDQRENSSFIYGQYGHIVQEWLFGIIFLASPTCSFQFALCIGLSYT